MDISTATYNRTRNEVEIHGTVYAVKKQRGRYYIHADNKQVTVTSLINTKEPDLTTVEGWQQLYEKNILNL